MIFKNATHVCDNGKKQIKVMRRNVIAGQGHDKKYGSRSWSCEGMLQQIKVMRRNVVGQGNEKKCGSRSRSS